MSADLGDVNLTGANLIEAKLDSDFDVSTVSYDENTVWPWDEDRESEKVRG